MLTRRAHLLLATALGALACRAPDTDTSDDTPSEYTVVGTAEKGPFVQGSSVLVLPLDAAGDPTGQAFTTQTLTNRGDFSLDVPAGTLSLEGTGFYFNEVTGALSGAPITLRGHAVADDREVAHLNIATHLAFHRVEALLSDQSAPDAIAQAQEELRVALQVGPDDLALRGDSSELSVLGGDGPDNAWLLAVSVLIEAVAIREVGVDGAVDATVQVVANRIALDMADGALEPAEVDALRAAQGTVWIERIEGALAEQFGETAGIPDLRTVLDSDLDGHVDADDNCPLARNVDQEDANSDGAGDACDCDGSACTSRWSSYTAGLGHLCGVRFDGEIACWGPHVYGQLGVGSLSAPPNFVGSPGLAVKAGPWRSVGASGTGTCAIWQDGSLWCWGTLQPYPTQSSPVRVGSETSWAEVVGGYNHACGVRADGSLACWGSNLGGALGAGDSTNSATPRDVESSVGWAQIDGDYGRTCGVKIDGTLWCWGLNQWGQAGVGLITCHESIATEACGTPDTTRPVQVGSDSDWRQVAAAERHTCATKTDGTLWCWGSNDQGVLGLPAEELPLVCGEQRCAASPVRVGLASTWRRVDLGTDATSCATRDDGSLWCWGLVDTITYGYSDAPTEVAFAGSWRRPVLANTHHCAERVDGSLWCWGSNHLGGLGDGTTISRTTPAEVLPPWP